MNITKNIVPVFLSLLMMVFLLSCEKDIIIDLPDAEVKLVVEGNIEQDRPPFVILTKSSPYFEPTDLTSLRQLFVSGALVTVSNGTNTVQLTEICTDQLPDSLLPAVAELIGVSLTNLQTFGFCVYTTLDTTMYGEIGKSYNLYIEADGKVATSSSQIPSLVYMNRYWYKDQPGFSNFGYLWFELSDPPQYGNAYRVFTKRVGKDSRFIPVFGSVFKDQFINGLTFEGTFARGQEVNSQAPDDLAETSEYYQQGDTVIIKFCTIDMPHFNFWETFEMASFSSGNPFSAPTMVETNINGGLGVWGGYGVTYDTLVLVD